ncbi:MAG: PQQ-binding-like beta-propeller repeat protein, partial [Polyangiales bacterium]
PLLRGYRGSVLAVSGLGRISVLGEQVELTLAPPASQLSVVDAADHSPFVIAATQGRILVWDLAQIIPERLPMERPIGYAVIGEHQIIAHFMDKPAEWHDLVKHDVTQLDIGIMPMLIISAERDDLMALVAPEGVGVYRRGARQPIQLSVSLALGFFTKADELLLGTSAGAIEIYAPPAYQRQTLFEHASEPQSVSSYSVGGSWVTATYADGTLWRSDLRTRSSTSIRTSGSIGWAFAVSGGDVFFAEGAHLKRWRIDGSVEIHAVLPREIRTGYLIDQDHVFVLTDDNAGYDVRLDAAGVVTSRLAPGRRGGAVAITSDLALTLDSSGSLLATDPVTGVRWTFARTSRAPFGDPVMARDGRSVFALGDSGLLMWKQQVPQTPEETRAFLDELTNARAPNGPAALSWD